MIASCRGLCEICELESASHKCGFCGRMVCSHDFNVERGVCLVCKETLCSFCGSKPSVKYCRICGRIGCEDCLIQVSLVSYVCRECYKTKYEFSREVRDVENR